MTHFVKYLFGRPRRWRREMTQAERVQGACAAQNGFPLCQLHRINDGVNGDDGDDDGDLLVRRISHLDLILFRSRLISKGVWRFTL